MKDYISGVILAVFMVAILYYFIYKPLFKKQKKTLKTHEKLTLEGVYLLNNLAKVNIDDTLYYIEYSFKSGHDGIKILTNIGYDDNTINGIKYLIGVHIGTKGGYLVIKNDKYHENRN